jgi:RNAse (barnase) inhibitor barstar
VADRVPSWDALLSPRAGWASLAVVPETWIDDFARSLPARTKATVRIVRGRRCRTGPALFQEWAAALQFPSYFGDNWDAFEECLTDREWLPGRLHVVLLTEVPHVLEDEEAVRPAFFGILKAAGEDPGGRTLRIVFQCGADDAPAMRALLGDHDILAPRTEPWGDAEAGG